MPHRLRLLIVLVLVAVTAVQCQALRSRANTLRVARVRRIDEQTGE